MTDNSEIAIRIILSINSRTSRLENGLHRTTPIKASVVTSSSDLGHSEIKAPIEHYSDADLEFFLDGWHRGTPFPKKQPRRF